MDPGLDRQLIVIERKVGHGHKLPSGNRRCKHTAGPSRGGVNARCTAGDAASGTVRGHGEDLGDPGRGRAGARGLQQRRLVVEHDRSGGDRHGGTGRRPGMPATDAAPSTDAAPATDARRRTTAEAGPVEDRGRRRRRSRRSRHHALDSEPAGCDPLDERSCLLPFPSNAYRVDGRVALPAEGTPVNAGGVGIDPAEWNRNDGFSPNAPMLTYIAGLDPDASNLPRGPTSPARSTTTRRSC